MSRRKEKSTKDDDPDRPLQPRASYRLLDSFMEMTVRSRRGSIMSNFVACRRLGHYQLYTVVE